MLHNGHKEDNVWNLEDSLGAYFGAQATLATMALQGLGS